ncbi:MAG TPA: MarR family transcriptional regulator [Gemmataceae bacterium]|nr:MarR family transcriptional regulator [Gemmataceae bacterium]
MVASGTGLRLEETARDLFEVVTQLGLTTLRGRRRSGDLKEVEFLTLAILHEHGSMIVGDIQRLLNVLPAQMSRIIRSLENRDRPLISCQINPRDKRKVDVCLTPVGEKALLDYQANKTDRLIQLLRDLPEETQEDLGRLVYKLHGLLERPQAT